MNDRFRNNSSKFRINKAFLLLNAVLILFVVCSTDCKTAQGQTRKTAATQPAVNPSAKQRSEYEEKARFLTDRLRPKANGEWLNWADEDDRREIIRRFAEGAKWWHAAGNYV